jgi:ABC-type Mn2+/Zn2+ transport system ATPase subunit
MERALIEFSNVDLGYGKRKILSDISLSIFSGDFFGIVGPNGAGKTTILRAILNIIKPIKGKLNFDKENIHFGYVPQQETIDLVMPYNVMDVVMMGRFKRIGLIKIPGKKDKQIVMDSLGHLGIENLAKAGFMNLSGGQKQRTLIARALAAEPNILVLDEPTSGMDISGKTAILEIIKQLHENENLTIIMVSHLLNDIANYAKRIALIDENFIQIGNVEEILNETNLSKLYNLSIKVEERYDKKIIIVGGKND